MKDLLAQFLNAFDNAILQPDKNEQIHFLEKAKNVILEYNSNDDGVFIGKPTLKAIENKIKELGE